MKVSNVVKFLSLIGVTVVVGGMLLLSERLGTTEINTAGKETPISPNVILFYVDDLGWKDVSFMGSQYYQTPNIDELSQQGMVFNNAYSNAPNCAPSRAAILSGQYGPRHGVYTVGSSERGKSEYRKIIPIKNNPTLDNNTWTMADAFKDAGYATASMGKFHVGDDPHDYGFDLNIGGDHKGGPYYGNKYFSPYNNPNISNGPEGEYITDRLTYEAINFIKGQADKPFFLYLTHFAVHSPLQAKAKIIAKYKNKPGHQGQDNPIYAAMVDSVDESLGRLVDVLKEQGLYDNTIIVFTSDNGGSGSATKARPLSGDKGSMYEGGYRVPFFVAWPGKIAAGTSSSIPVIATDLFPTFLDIIKQAKPADKILDGESLLSVLTHKGELSRQAIFWHFPSYLSGSKNKGLWRSTPFGAVRQGDYKLIEFFEDGRLELYNLKDDISENHNLANQLPEKTKSLHKLMLDWRIKTKAPVPSHANSGFDQQALNKRLLAEPKYVR